MGDRLPRPWRLAQPLAIFWHQPHNLARTECEFNVNRRLAAVQHRAAIPVPAWPVCSAGGLDAERGGAEPVTGGECRVIAVLD